MEEDTPPDIFQQLSDLAEVNSEFEEQWEAIYKDCDDLYHIRLKYPDDFQQISRILLDDREHATDSGKHIFNGLIEKLTNEHESKSIDKAQKSLIRKWRKELQTIVHNSPYDYLEKIQLKLNEETAIYLPFAEPKDSSVEPETSPTNVQEQPGMCIILADKDFEDDAKTFKELLTYLGYETKQIEAKKDRMSTLVIQDHLKANTSVNHRSAVVIVIDFGYGDTTDQINGYQYVFDGCDELKNKPKILITHLYDGELGKLNQPPDNILHIVSHVKDDDTGPSLFIQSLDAVFRKHHSMCDIYELLTKVLRDVEIPQHIKWRNMTAKPGKYPHHSVIFKTSLKSPFRLSTTGKDIPDVPTLLNTGVTSLLLGQYKQLKRISKYDLKKVFSVDIELKLTDAFYKNHYRMNRKPRGLCVIVNMSNDRSGSLVDEIKMAQLFEELYFDVKIISNRTHAEIEQEIETLTSAISDLHQCSVVFIMGHGTTENNVHHFADVTYTKEPSDYVLDVFKNQANLIGKPKIFIIQTCFGVQKMGGHSAETKGKEADSFDEPASNRIRFAVHKDSDTIKLNATLQDYMSFRNALEGSYLLQCVDQVLREDSAKDDVTQLMTSINNKVRELCIKRNFKQQAKVENTLNSHLYLNPGYSVSEQFPLPDISTCKQLWEEGSSVWSASPVVACVADRFNTWIKLVNLETNETSVYEPSDPGDVSGILSGVSVRGIDDRHPNEHVIVVKTSNGYIEVLLVTLIHNTWQPLKYLSIKGNFNISEWSIIEERSDSHSTENHLEAARKPRGSDCEPLTLCPVNDDAFAVLLGTRRSSECMIHVYRCDDIRSSDACKTNARLRVKCKTRSLTSRNVYLGIRDSMCYSNTRFYISCFSSSTVFQFDSLGNIEQVLGEAALGPRMKTPGSLYKPCGLFTNTSDSSERITIACYDGIHQARVLQNGDGKWKTEWLSDVLPLDRVHGMWYNNSAVLNVTDSGLNYTSLPSVPNLEVSSLTTLTPNHTHHFNSQLVQTVWSTLDPDIVAVGSAESAHIFLLRSDGELLATEFIDMQARIMSGINLYGNKHLTVLRDDNKSFLYRVELTGDDKKSVLRGDQVIDGKTNHNVTFMTREEGHGDFEPISLVTVEGGHYALLCRLESHIGCKNKAVIKLYNRKTLKHKKTMVLDDIDVGVNDRVCVDMNGFYIISSYGKKRIYTFDVDGTMLAQIDTPGVNPCSVMVDETNNLLVQCENSLYKYMQTQNRDSESATSDWKTIIDKPSWDVCYSGQNLYTVYRNTLSVYQTDNHIHSSTSCKGEIVTSEHKNPPLLKFAKRAILEGDQIQKYHYPPLWPTTSFNSVTSDRSIDIDAEPGTCWSAGDNDSIIVGGWNKHNQPTLSVVTYDRSIDIDAEPRTCWSAGDNDSIIVGGWNKPSLSFVSATGRYITHVLSCGRQVISGLLVKMLLHIVCVTYVDKWWEIISSNKLHLITLDHTSTHSSIIHPLITLDVTNPVHVFRKSTQLCGVLCMDRSDTYTHGRIRLLGLDQLILPTYTNPRTLQSTALWGRRTLLHLDLPKPHPYDTVAVTPRGQYCICSCTGYEILVYSSTGVYVYNVGERQPYTSDPGRLFEPVSVQCTADNCVIVTERLKGIQMYNMSSETGRLVRRKYDGGNYRMVKDDVNDDEEYNKAGRRKVYYYKDDPDGWRIVRHRDERLLVRHRAEIGYVYYSAHVYCSALTSSRLWEVYYNPDTNTTGIRVYNITQ